MKTSLGACAAVAVALMVSACGEKPVPPKPLPNPPSITSFSADKTRVTPGEAVTLIFTAAYATDARIIDQHGEKVDLQTDGSAGTAIVHPTETSFYVLTVKGDGGSASSFVQVAVNEDLRQVFLVTVPPEIDSGESAQLLWSAFHAKKVKLTEGDGAELQIDGANGSGVLSVSPARTTHYQLVASGVDSSKELTQTADLTVRPVLEGFTVNPGAAKVGQTMSFSWDTRGAAEVTLSEKTFGELNKVAVPADEKLVDHGTFQWTVPDTVNGQPVTVGFPLEFALTVKQTDPELTLTKKISSFVGEGPKVTVTMPPAVTEGHSFNLKWETINATRLQVLAHGQPIFEPLPRDQAKVAAGSLTLKAPQADTTYQVIAYGHEGTTANATQDLHVVKAPAVTSFTLPGSIAAPGDPAHATWTTTDATSVTLRIKNGPVLYTTSKAADVASGGADLYVGLRTKVVLEAWNDAGDVASEEKTLEVATPGTVTATPSPVTPGQDVTVTWSFDPAATAGTVGDPSLPPLKNNPANEWYELDGHVDAQPLNFSDPDNAVAEIPVRSGFAFPFFGQAPTTFFVSTNGFVSFTDAGPLASNDRLDDASSSAPAMVAPFWDDLTLGDAGEVLYLVEGTSFPRRLIIQWNKVHTVSDPASELTFEVQLYETGEIYFGYKTLTGGDSGGDSASVGYRLNGKFASERALPTPAPILTPEDELIYLTNGGMSGQYVVQPDAASVFTFFARLPTGKYVAYPAKVNVMVPGSVEISEVMVSPEMSATAGKWVELHNTTGKAVDLSGAQLTSAATATSYTFAEGTEIPANGYFVVGESTDPLQNGGATVNLAWTDLTLDPSVDDTLSVMAGTEAVSSFSYVAKDVLPGSSLQIAYDPIDTNGATIPCNRTQTFGSNGAIGTPGTLNETCFDYVLSTIGVDFEDISASGTALITGSFDDQHKQVALNTAVPYFGTAQSDLGVSANGFVFFGTIDSGWWTNKDLPSSQTDPVGAISSFWDDLGDNDTAFPDTGVYVQQFPDRTVVQWHHVSRRDSSDLNFEVKLFTDGTIEFHYANMTPPTSGTNYADGNSATVWIESPAGDVALPISINTAGNFAQKAWRFTPVP